MKSLIIKRILVLGCLASITAPAVFALTPASGSGAVVRRGSDTGNGGNGGSLLANVPKYQPLAAASWCGAVSGMLADALRWSEMSDSVPLARQYLVESTSNILASFDDGTLGFQPLTYSLLKHVLAVNDVFPAEELGDQAAVIFLYHMIDVAKRVSANFDVPRYIPIYRNYRRCSQLYCEGEDSANYGPLYTDYISSVQMVLGGFFSPALPSHPERGNVLDAMADDRWELNALSEVLGWIVADISNDVFGRRQFECLSVQLSMAKQRVDDYLSGQATLPFTDRRMRRYAEEVLHDTLSTLDGYRYGDGRGICR